MKVKTMIKAKLPSQCAKVWVSFLRAFLLMPLVSHCCFQTVGNLHFYSFMSSFGLLWHENLFLFVCLLACFFGFTPIASQRLFPVVFQGPCRARNLIQTPARKAGAPVLWTTSLVHKSIFPIEWLINWLIDLGPLCYIQEPLGPTWIRCKDLRLKCCLGPMVWRQYREEHMGLLPGTPWQCWEPPKPNLWCLRGFQGCT